MSDRRRQRRTDNADPRTSIRRVHRADRGTLRPPVVRADGSLIVTGLAAGPGILEYVNDDGSIRRERVTQATLDAAAAGLSRAPVTLDHPDEDVTPENISEYEVGKTGEKIRVTEGGYTEITFVVSRSDGIRAAQSGTHLELSCGYYAVVDDVAGIDEDGNHYDGTQQERHYNHVAMVEEARGGPALRIRMDSADGGAGDDADPVYRYVSRTVHREDTAPDPAKPQGVPMELKSLIALAALLGVESAASMEAPALTAEIHRRVDGLRKRADTVEELTADAEEAKTDAEETAAKLDQLKADNAELMGMLGKTLDRIQGDTEALELDELEPLADEMGVETKKTDTADTIRRRIAAAQLGMRLDAVDTNGARLVVASLLKDREPSRRDSRREAHREDSRDAGRARGRKAWRADARDVDDDDGEVIPIRRGRRFQSRRDAIDDFDGPGLSAIAARHHDEAFRGGRNGA